MDTRNGSGSEKISPSLQLQLVTPKAILLVEDDPDVARLTISYILAIRRRISLKNYVDDKVTSSYMQQISEIRAMEDAIRDRLSDIFNYIQCTEESASERQSDQIGE